MARVEQVPRSAPADVSGDGSAPPQDMHMITPGVAAALTPTSVERDPRPDTAPRARGRVRVPRVQLHLPRPHLPHRHA